MISDIMMPEMDGIDLCKKVKSTFEISHIPIILLTAIVGDIERLESYQAGANSYIAKPVQLKVLQARIKSLLELRQLLAKKYTNCGGDEIREFEHSDIDIKFLKIIRGIIEENISDPEFNISL